MKLKNRWYDKHTKLAVLLERLQKVKREQRDALICGVMELIKRSAPNLLEQYVLDFPLDIKRRRWYDKDPYLWLLFNGLQYADKPLLTDVTRYLEEKIRPKIPSAKTVQNPRIAKK